MNKGFLKKKKVVRNFSLISLLTGTISLWKSNHLVGNVILEQTHSFNLFSLIGIALIFCSAILGVYLIKRR